MKSRFTPWMWLVVVGLTACASVPPPPPQLYYRLIPAGSPRPVTPAPHLRIRVPPFAAAGVVGDSAMLFRDGGAAAPLQQYYYRSWAQPPAEMLAQALRDWLAVALAPAQVVDADTGVPADIVVHGRLLTLDRVQTRHTVDAELSLEFLIADTDGRCAATLRFSARRATAGRGLQSYVAAEDILLREAFDSVAGKVAAVAGGRDAQCAEAQRDAGGET